MIKVNDEVWVRATVIDPHTPDITEVNLDGADDDISVWIKNDDLAVQVQAYVLKPI